MVYTEKIAACTEIRKNRWSLFCVQIEEILNVTSDGM